MTFSCPTNSSLPDMDDLSSIELIDSLRSLVPWRTTTLTTLLGVTFLYNLPSGLPRT